MHILIVTGFCFLFIKPSLLSILNMNFLPDFNLSTWKHSELFILKHSAAHVPFVFSFLL